jgi:hypothetical protein
MLAWRPEAHAAVPSGIFPDRLTVAGLTRVDRLGRE